MRKTILEDEGYLRQISEEVDFDDKTYLEDIDKLEEYCKNNDVFAMAGVQIGIPKRIIYLKNTTADTSKNSDKNYNEGKILINPIVKKRRGKTRFLEGCESCSVSIEPLKYLAAVIHRPYSLEVKYYDIFGNKQSEMFKGFPTTVLSHELDHLDGILHIDLVEKSDVKVMGLQEIKLYRGEHPYEIISEDCDYEEG